MADDGSRTKPPLTLRVLSLRYSSWSMRAWLALTHAGVSFTTQTVELTDLKRQGDEHEGQPGLAGITADIVAARRQLGSVAGLFPVLQVSNVAIHESLAICEFAADNYAPTLWPTAVLDRARARAISCEMVGGFANIRGTLSCHLFGRVPKIPLSAGVAQEVNRVFEIWSECLESSGGPFLFGQFTIADAMYFPVLSRFATYNIALPSHLLGYSDAINDVPAVQALMAVAASEPAVPIYDAYISELGGDPNALLPRQR